MGTERSCSATSPPARGESELELLWAFSVLVAKGTCLRETFCASDKRPAGALVDWPPHLGKCSMCPVALQERLGLLRTPVLTTPLPAVVFIDFMIWNLRQIHINVS